MNGEILREAGALLLVFALLAIVQWVFRRSGRASSGARPMLTQPDAGVLERIGWKSAGKPARANALELLERLTLTPSHSIFRVRAGHDELLIATHAQGCTLLQSSREESQSYGTSA